MNYIIHFHRALHSHQPILRISHSVFQSRRLLCCTQSFLYTDCLNSLVDVVMRTPQSVSKGQEITKERQSARQLRFMMNENNIKYWLSIICLQLERMTLPYVMRTF